jgi:DNA-binding LytR/AlgR family response regulator
VTTTAGRALVLLRLSDAIAEAEGVPGLQIHRSHWVTLAAVARVRRDGARVLLVLKDGRELPVSRTFMPQARLAGLL